MRDRPVGVLARVLECDGEPVESVAINVRVDVVIPQSAGDRLDQRAGDLYT